MKFTIHKVERGYVLNVAVNKVIKHYVYSDLERLVMFTKINETLGELPKGSVGEELPPEFVEKLIGEEVLGITEHNRRL